MTYSQVLFDVINHYGPSWYEQVTIVPGTSRSGRKHWYCQQHAPAMIPAR